MPLCKIQNSIKTVFLSVVILLPQVMVQAEESPAASNSVESCIKTLSGVPTSMSSLMGALTRLAKPRRLSSQGTLPQNKSLIDIPYSSMMRLSLQRDYDAIDISSLDGVEKINWADLIQTEWNLLENLFANALGAEAHHIFGDVDMDELKLLTQITATKYKIENTIDSQAYPYSLHLFNSEYPVVLIPLTYHSNSIDIYEAANLYTQILFHVKLSKAGLIPEILGLHKDAQGLLHLVVAPPGTRSWSHHIYTKNAEQPNGDDWHRIEIFLETLNQFHIPFWNLTLDLNQDPNGKEFKAMVSSIFFPSYQVDRDDHLVFRLNHRLDDDERNTALPNFALLRSQMSFTDSRTYQLRSSRSGYILTPDSRPNTFPRRTLFRALHFLSYTTAYKVKYLRWLSINNSSGFSELKEFLETYTSLEFSYSLPHDKDRVREALKSFERSENLMRSNVVELESFRNRNAGNPNK